MEKHKLPNDYFPHDFNARFDRKILRCRKVLGIEGYGIYWMLIETLCLQENFSYPLKDIDLLADDFGCSVQKVEAVVKQFELFQIDKDAKFFSMSLIARMQKYLEISEKARLSVNKRWEKARELKEIETSDNKIIYKGVEIDKWKPQSENKSIRSARLSEARKKGTHTKEEWQEMKDFFDNTCIKCYGNTELNGVVKDHIIPIYQGGSDGIDNIQPLCAKCNVSKGSENIDHRIAYCEAKDKEMPTKWLRNYYENTTIKEKDIKEKKIKEDNIPELSEFITYCKTLSIYHSSFDFQIEAKYNAWVENKWKDGNNKPIKNWKTKIQNTMPYFKKDLSNGRTANQQRRKDYVTKDEYESELKNLYEGRTQT